MSASAGSNGIIAGAQRIIAHQEEKHLPGGWVILKFGGTSIGKYASNVAEIVQNLHATSKIAIVCSARSSKNKVEGTTNRLLRAAREAEKRTTRNYDEIVEAIRVDHLEAAKSIIKSSDILETYSRDVQAECDSLTKILESAQHLEEVSIRAEDKIISKGEKLSCRFMTAVLQDRGVDAHYTDLSNVIHTCFVRPLSEEFYKETADSLSREVMICGSRLPVITGFFGDVPGGLLSAVGRGYTDLCAALIAIGLKADELQIWKEVDGIFTADPCKVPTARLIPSVTPAEAAELTFYGSEVIHPFTMEQVIRERIPIRIKNVMNPRNNGTVIFPDALESPCLRKHAPRHGFFRTRSATDFGLRPKRPTAVTVKHKIVVLNVHSNKRTRAHGFLMKIFQILDKCNLSVDLISSSEVHVSMALHSESDMLNGRGQDDYEITDRDLRAAVEELSHYGTVDIVPNMATISLVGKQLKNMVGISGKFFSALGDNNVNIEMISQGASEINISCVIEEREADRALSIIHTNLFTFLD